jgi:hypothetical protein
MIQATLGVAMVFQLTSGLCLAQEQPQALTPREISEAAQQGRSAGQSLSRSVQMPVVDRDAKTITINGEVVPFRELVPGSERAGGLPSDQELGEMAGNQTLIDNAAKEKHRQLQNAVTVEGQVYRDFRNGKRATDREVRGLLLDTQKQAPLWKDTIQAFASGAAGADLGACQTQTRWEGAPEETGYTVSQKSCERIHKLDRCERKRELTDESRSNVEVATRSHTLTAPEEFSVTITNELPSGTVLIAATARLSFTGSAESVTITQQPSRDNGWKVRYRVVPGPPVTTCRDVLGMQCTAGTPGCICSTQSGTVRVTVIANLTAIRETFSSEPDNCLMETDQFCTARWTCDDNEPRTFAGVQIDGTIGSQLGLLYPNVVGNVPESSRDPVCYQATALYQCDFMLGQLCWTDAQGRQQCVNNTEQNTMLDTCAPLREDTSCGLARTSCAEGARGHGGFCYVEDLLYECRQQVPASAITPVTQVVCDGQIVCAGTQCAPMENEVGGGFAKAQAGLTVAQHFLSDRKETPGTQDVKMFAGKPMECKKALGSLASCCTETRTSAPKDWMEMYSERMRLGSVNQAIRTMGKAGAQQSGGWEGLGRNDQVDRSALNNSFTAPIETVTAGDNISTQGLPQEANLQEMSTEFTLKAREEYQPDLNWMCSQEEFDLANQKELGTCTEIGSYCKTSVFGACLDKRTVSCCFASPLSRQIRETMAGGQAGIAAGAFGTPKAPRCDGVAIEQAASANVSNLNLDEWVGRMQKAGALPTMTAAQMDSEYSLEKLTGSQSVANQLHTGPALAKSTGEDRKNTAERTGLRMDAVDIERAAMAIEGDLVQDDPGAVPDANGPGEIYLGPAYTATIAGRNATIYFMRVGKRGRVSVRYRLVDGSATAGVHFVDRAGLVEWGDGVDGLQTVAVPTVRTPGQATALKLFVELSDPSGGAALGETRTGTIVINPIR